MARTHSAHRADRPWRQNHLSPDERHRTDRSPQSHCRFYRPDLRQQIGWAVPTTYGFSMRRIAFFATIILVQSIASAEDSQPLTISWDKNYLTIRGDFP